MRNLMALLRGRKFRGVLDGQYCAPIEALEQRVLLSVNVVSYRDGAVGVNSLETALTTANVGGGSVGKQFSVAVDGQVYAQPLVESGVTINNGVNTSAGAAGVHNVVFVATEHDSIYAIDTVTGNVLWKRTFLDSTSSAVGTVAGTDINNPLGASAITTVPATDTNSDDLTPEIGITGTPVIDSVNGRLYVVVPTKETIGGAQDWVQTVHAINLSDGTDVAQPFLISETAEVNGTTGNITTSIYAYGSGDGEVTDPYNGTGKPVVQFNALRENQRGALSLVNNVLYVDWSSHGDQSPYHGWIVGWDVSNLATSGFVLKGVFNDTPNGGQGGIWMGGGSLAFESDGTTFYAAIGNGAGNTGTYDANGFPTDGNYGESVVKLVPDATTSPANQSLNGWGFKVADFFTPYNRATLDAGDVDFGSGGILVLPTGIPGHPNVMVVAGKEGKIYVIDRNNLGKFDPNNDHVLNAVANGSGNNTPPVLLAAGSYSAPAYFNGVIYWVTGQYGGEYAFTLNSDGSLTETGAAPEINLGYLPGSPVVSANGTSNGIVWQIDRNANVLRAYSAGNLGDEIWNSGTSAGNALDSTVKFAPVTVANGEVFVGTQDSVTVYGLSPTNLTDLDIGAPKVAGSASFSAGTWTISGGGADIWFASDQFNYAEESISGDNTVVAGVTSLTGANIGAYSSAGIMIRDGTGANAAFAFVISGKNGADFKYRTSAGATAAESGWSTSQTPVYWVKLVRSGNVFTAYTAADAGGAAGTWVQIGTPQTIAMSNPDAGLAVTADNNGALATATFTDFSVTPTTSGLTDMDIGGPAFAGSASFGAGTWPLTGGGADIWFSSDQFNYAYQNISGDNTVIARVTSLGGANIGAYSSAGVMIRDGTGANAAFAFVISGKNGADFKYRTSTGATAAESGWKQSQTPVYWVKLVRSGNTFTASTAPDMSGVAGTWTQIGAKQTIAMSNPNAGLAVTADNNAALATATFTNFSVTPATGGLTDADIGGPNLAGSAVLNGGTWTLSGGGADIWFGSDQFNYAYENISGDNTVIARVASLGGANIGAYSSAGVMIRDGTAANAAFAFVISGVNGADFKYRTSTGATAAESGWKQSQTPVYWVKLVRSGNTFTAYTAPDVSGTAGTWTQIGSTQTIAMSNPNAGLAVTADNNAALATATFTNFSVTSGVVNAALITTPVTAVTTASSWVGATTAAVLKKTTGKVSLK